MNDDDMSIAEVLAMCKGVMGMFLSAIAAGLWWAQYNRTAAACGIVAAFLLGAGFVSSDGQVRYEYDRTVKMPRPYNR